MTSNPRQITSADLFFFHAPNILQAVMQLSLYFLFFTRCDISVIYYSTHARTEKCDLFVKYYI